MAGRTDFAARAAISGVDDITKPWGKALRRAEWQAGRTFTRMEKASMRVRRGMRKGLRAIGRIPATGGRAFGMASRALGGFAKVAGGAAAISALAADRFGKYELAVARIGNLLDDDTDTVKEYGAELKNLAVKFGIDELEVAEGAYMAFSGGVKTSKKALMDFLPAAAKAAKAGGSDLATAVDAITSVLNVFGDTGLRAIDVADKLFVTEALGKTDFNQIAASIGSVVGMAKELEVPLDDVLAGMASITKTGVDTNVAFTQLAAVISAVTNARSKQVKAFKKVGRSEGKAALPFGPDAFKRAGGIVNWFQKLSKISDKYGKGIIQKLLGRKEAQLAAFRLSGTGLKDMQNTVVALRDSGGKADKNFANIERRTGYRIQQMKVGFGGLISELGAGIAEGIGINELDDAPERFANAGKKVRSGAKNFAQGFLAALSPGENLANLDFDALAKRFGEALGTGVNVIAKFATAAADAVNWVTKELTPAITAAAGAWSFEDGLKVDEMPDPMRIAAEARKETEKSLGADVSSMELRSAASMAQDKSGFAGFGGGRSEALERTVDTTRQLEQQGKMKVLDSFAFDRAWAMFRRNKSKQEAWISAEADREGISVEAMTKKIGKQMYNRPDWRDMNLPKFIAETEARRQAELTGAIDIIIKTEAGVTATAKTESKTPGVDLKVGTKKVGTGGS